MIKRITAAALAAVMSLTLFAACGNEEKESETNATVTPTAAAEAPTEAPEDKGIKYTIPDKVFEDEYPITETEVEVTSEMEESSIVCPGNQQRLAEVMSRAAAGEEITIAYIGGSITDGSSATPQAEKCYAGLTQVWWENTFKDAKINYVNAGVGATDSYIGVHRAAKDVIAKKPDLVVVEFSVNDYRGNNQETYESLVRMLLDSETKPAVVSLVLCTETSYYQDHYLVANTNKIPCVSYAKIVQTNLASGLWSWDQLGAADKTHPINGGHAVISHLLTYFYSTVLHSINDTSYEEYVLPEKSQTKSRYEEADILYGDNIEPVSADGFEAAVVNSNFFDNNGWITTTGGSISFEVEAKNIGVIFWGTKDGQSGQFDVYIDDELAGTIDADFKNEWGSYASYLEISKFDTKEKRTIRIEKSADSTGDKLMLIALTVS